MLFTLLKRNAFCPGKLTVWFGLVLLCLQVKGQSFHYFRYQVADSGNTTSEALLTLFANGTSTARIREVKIPADASTVFESVLTDTIIFDPEGKPVRQLFPVTTTVAGSNAGKQVDHSLLFDLEEQFINQTGFYAPASLKTWIQGTWKPARILENSAFSYAQMDTNIVKRFYQVSEPYYTSLFSNIRQPALISRGLNSSQKKTKIYMIIVTDTLDEKAGKACKRDMENMSFVFTNISKKAGLAPPVITYVSGKSFNKKGVLNALSKTNPGPDDILIYYYSGHGYREAGDSSALPKMVLSNNYTMATLRENSLAMQTVVDNISKKKSRLNLVFNDCCNVETALPAATGKNPLISPKSIGLPLSIENFVKLFLTPKGTITGSSSRPAEYSVGNPDKGGFFTWYLLMALETQLSRYNRNIAWDDIFAEAGKNATYLALSGLCGEEPNQARCVQNPWANFSLLKN